MEAATCEFDQKNINNLLQAAVFGRTFLETCGTPDSQMPDRGGGGDRGGEGGIRGGRGGRAAENRRAWHVIPMAQCLGPCL